jgi:hypothetical protein
MSKHTLYIKFIYTTPENGRNCSNLPTIRSLFSLFYALTQFKYFTALTFYIEMELKFSLLNIFWHIAKMLKGEEGDVSVAA